MTPEYDLAPIGPLVRLLLNLAYPYYACECCVGQEPWRGCYCDHYRCYAPGSGPPLGPTERDFLDQPWVGIAAGLARPVYDLAARRTGNLPRHDCA